MIPDKYETDLFPSSIKIKAANGTIIDNSGNVISHLEWEHRGLHFPSYAQVNYLNRS